MFDLILTAIKPMQIGVDNVGTVTDNDTVDYSFCKIYFRYIAK